MPDEKTTAKLLDVSSASAGECLMDLRSREQGLSAEEAAERQSLSGLNVILHKKAASWYVQLFQSFISPFNGVLALIGISSFITENFFVSTEEREFKTIILLTIMVVLSSILRFWQEYRSNKAAEELKNMVKTTATVYRDGTSKEIDIKELVPGDIIFLSAGDMIPADCRVLQSKDLFIGQSVLTGESLPVEKTEQPVLDTMGKSPLEMGNLCFMGTNVVSGSSKAIVVITGSQTYFGTISRSLTEKRIDTSFDKGVTSVSWLLIRFIMIMVPLVFLINGIGKGNWLEAFLFAITVAVGLTPEMLPMIVTTNLAKGAISMSKRKVIIKRLNAIQNIGAMDVLCTDKTGTLTMDKIILQLHINVDGENDYEVLKWAYLNSFHQTGLKNQLDLAVLEHTEVHNLLDIEARYFKVDEIPFDFQRRRMSVILQQDTGKHLLICKGALEEMLPLCTHAFDPGEDHELHIEQDKVVPMDDKMRQTVVNTCKRLNEEGLRVLVIAIREFDNRALTYSVADESNLILTGFIAFLDPPKSSAKSAIEEISRLGVNIKVLTGDNEVITRKICRDVGVPFNDIITGSELDRISDNDLKNRIEGVNIFAKLNPMQKSRIVKVLQEQGHTVGFLGDGINDAPSLKDADVGISVDTAVDITKESADIILLEKDLMVLRQGIMDGRRTFGNIIKYIKMSASSNFGNMFSVLGASIFLPFLPLLPIQILTQNLLYDISQIATTWDNMDKEFLETPQKWNTQGIERFMFFIGPISSIFDFMTFGVMIYIFHANTPEHQSVFQTGWFIEGLLSQTLIVHMIRTRKIPFIQSRATPPVIALTGLIMLVGILIPYTPFAPALGMQPLPLRYFLWLTAILSGYCVLTQIMKGWFIRKFNYWL